MPRFSEIDKANIIELFDRSILKHRHESACDFAFGCISEEEDAWNQKHANYIESLKEKVIAILNI